MASPQCSPDPERQYARTRCIWPPAITSKKYSSQVVIVMRSEERMDRIFGVNWQLTEQPTGRCHPTDLNVPATNLNNYAKDFDLKNNPPITVMGKYKAILTARAVQNRNLAPRQIICSPTLRSIETAAAVAGYLKVPICIEPGLSDHPAGQLDYNLPLLTETFNIDSDYKPLVPWTNLSTSESSSDVAGRVQSTLKALMQRDHSRALFIVAHGLVQAALCHLASGVALEDIQEEMKRLDPIEIGLRFPPGSIVTAVRATEEAPYHYCIVNHLIPPLSYGLFFSNAPVPMY